MNLHVRPYTPADADDWDAFCATAHQATFLHTRRFLSHHGNRFHDYSVIVEDDRRWVAVFPAALHLEELTTVVSHPGITYGGLIHRGDLRGDRMLDAIRVLCRWYVDHGIVKLMYKAVPMFYHAVPAQDDLYALFRLGALRTRCDLSSTIDLQYRTRPSERRRRSLKKALKAGVDIKEGVQYLPHLWQVVTDNLQRKHQTSPTHSLEEIMLLTESFPDNIYCIVGVHRDSIVAGLVVFSDHNVDHAQYIASSEVGYQIAALDALLESCITRATDSGKRWFDFGISTENSGRFLNDGLYRFKSEFGGGGTVHEFFELNLARC